MREWRIEVAVVRRKKGRQQQAGRQGEEWLRGKYVRGSGSWIGLLWAVILPEGGEEGSMFEPKQITEPLQSMPCTALLLHCTITLHMHHYTTTLLHYYTTHYYATILLHYTIQYDNTILQYNAVLHSLKCTGYGHCTVHVLHCTLLYFSVHVHALYCTTSCTCRSNTALHAFTQD